MLSESSNFAGAGPDGPFIVDEIPALIRTELNADTDCEVLERMRYLAHRKRILQPFITDEEMADYLALAENHPNVGQWLSARRGTIQSPLRASILWVVATLAVVGMLTAMLIAGIALAV